MGLELYHTISAPFAEYPLTRRFDNRIIPRIIIVLSAFLLLCLVLFNVNTQGRLAHTETVLSPHWYPRNDTCDCQPATLEVGNTYFTNEALASHMKDRDGNKTKTDHRGDFGWTIEKRTNTRTSFLYQEGNLNCNVTDILLLIDFFVTSFWYRICTRCSTPRVESRSENNHLSLCAMYDSYEQAGPIFTEKAQSALRTQIYSFYSRFKESHFAPNTLRGLAFSPDHALKNSTISQTAIAKRDIIGWSAGMDSFNYTPADDVKDSSLSYIRTRPQAQGKLYLSVNDTEPIGFSEGILQLLSRGSFTLKLVALGVGQVYPFPTNSTLKEVSRLPNPLPKYFNLTESILALMMDTAAKDIQNRVLAVGYLCTVTRKSWKTFFPMLAMIIGNCSAMFGAGLTAMICIARRCEASACANPNYQENSQNLDLEHGRKGTISENSNNKETELQSSSEEAK